MALGFQIRPDLSGEQMKTLLFESAWINENGLHFVDPPAFIAAVRNAE